MIRRLVPWAIAGVAALAVGCDRERAASADGHLLAFPATLDFARVAMYGDHTMDVELQNAGRSILTIDEIAFDGAQGAYSADLPGSEPGRLEPDARAGMRVHFRPMAPGDQAAELVIRTDSLRSREVRIPLSGVGVDAHARFTADTLDYGRIEAQARKTLTITFENSADIDVQVGTRFTGKDADEFTASSFTLGPLERRAVAITFAPGRVGTKAAGLVVSPCDGCQEVPVRLVAEALDRAVVAEPWEVDFGAVPMDRYADGAVKLHNISTEPVVLYSMGLATGTDVAFTATNTRFPINLLAGEVRTFPVRFSPGHLGDSAGSVAFREESVRNPQLVVPLRGFGGRPDICLAPSSYDFGMVPVGSKSVMTINVKNCGATEAVNVTRITWGGDGIPGEDQYGFLSAPLPQTLAPGAEMPVRVYYEPSRAGDAGGYLRVFTTAYSGSFRVAINGRARVSNSCVVSLTPPALDFGTVPPGSGVVLGLKVRNSGTDLCAVKNIQMFDNAGSAYWLPGGNIDGVIMQPGDYFSFMVAFRAPTGGGQSFGSLQVESADPNNPRFLVPLVANAQGSCVVAAPRFLDYGTARPDCPPAAGRVTLMNGCAEPADISRIAIGPGTTDGEFVITSAPPTPLTLQPGQTASVSVQYRALVAGLNLSPLFVSVDGLPAPYLVPLVGESSTRVDQVDRFTQQDASKVDVLFVVDNTSTMVEEHPRLVQGIPSFVTTALSKGVDLRVAVTTTGVDPANPACPGGADGGEAGRFFPADGSNQRILSNATPNLSGELQQNVQVGLCTYVEEGLEAMRRALSDPLVSSADDPRTPLPSDGNLGFLREEAALAVVFVGDEDDNSADDVGTYVRFLQSKKGLAQPQRAVIYAIAPTAAQCPTAGGIGTRYAEAATRTGGAVLSVCAPDYGPLLQDVANKAFSPQTRFPLSATPAGGSISVTVNGAGVSGWSYDPAGNAVVFATAPAPGARVAVSYRRTCP